MPDYSNMPHDPHVGDTCERCGRPAIGGEMVFVDGDTDRMVFELVCLDCRLEAPQPPSVKFCRGCGAAIDDRAGWTEFCPASEIMCGRRCPDCGPCEHKRPEDEEVNR